MNWIANSFGDLLNFDFANKLFALLKILLFMSFMVGSHVLADIQQFDSYCQWLLFSLTVIFHQGYFLRGLWLMSSILFFYCLILFANCFRK